MASFAPEGPTNSLVTPILTDMYQVSMAYAYWKNGKAEDAAVFELFFRKNPFGGEFTIFAGLDEVLRFVSTYKFSKSDVDYLRTLMPTCEDDFFSWLEELNCKDVKIYAIQEGSVVFPREPLIRVEGPLAAVQLLETTLLNLVNFPSLVATNAARMRLAAGADKKLLEFGLRRAQGPDGGLSASKYAYLGGFDGTANVLAGKLFSIKVSGTHAHSFVMSFTGLADLQRTSIFSVKESKEVDFVAMVQKYRTQLGYTETNEGELAAFISYAQAFPTNLLCLIDTYEIAASGVKNFLCVALALLEAGYRPLGVRLDSGDLAYWSKFVRGQFRSIDRQFGLPVAAGEFCFAKCTIVASNDINEDVLLSLNREGHEIDVFGIGTHLVTCQRQPALGCVFKLVEINSQPRIKLSQEIEKMVIPGRKVVYRLYGADDVPLVDLLQTCDESAPLAGKKLLVRHPFEENKRAYISPQRVEELMVLAFDGASGFVRETLSLDDRRARCFEQLALMRHDHVRPLNPCPYKISVSENLYNYLHDLWMSELPIKELA